MKTKQNQELDLTQGVIWRQMLRFFWPICLGMLFQTLYSTVDALIVGRLVGSGALAAVGNTSSVINVLVGFFNGLSAGATVLTAQYFGARNRSSLLRCVGTSLFLSGVLGLIMTVLALVLAPWIMTVIETPAEIYADSVLYLRLYALGMIPMSVYNLGSGVLRGLGDSKSPVRILAVSSVCNVVLDIVLVTVIPLGVAGVAIATTVSQIVSFALVWAIFARGRCEGLCIRLRDCRPGRGMVGQVLRIGVPAAVQSTSYNFTNLLLQAAINGFGTATVAAWTAYSKVDTVFWLTSAAMSSTITTFVGQNYGACNLPRVKKGVRTALGMSVGMTVGTCVLLIVFCEPLFRVFTPDPQVVEIGCEMLRFLAMFYGIYTVSDVFSGAVRATGDSFWPMVLNLISVCLVRLLWVWLVLPRFHTILMLCTSYPVSWAIGSVLFILYYRSGRWDKHRLRHCVSQ